MPRLPRVLLLVALAGQLALLAPGWTERFDPTAWQESGWVNLLWVVGATFVGRVALSLLPPGPVGRHVPGSLGETLAVSMLLGLAITALQQRLLPMEDLGVTARLGWNLAPWVAVAGLRSLMLPAAMVPGHALAHERGPAWSRGLTGFSITAAIAWSLAAGETPFWGAGLLLFDSGLRTLRRAPAERALLVAFAAAATPTVGAIFSQVHGVYLLAGLLLGLRWIRRADRRSLVLACLLLGLGEASRWNPLATLAALGILVAAAHAPQRKAALPWLLLAAALPLWHLGEFAFGNGALPSMATEPLLQQISSGWARFGLLWPLLVVALGLGLPKLEQAHSPSRAPLREPDPIRREALCAVAFVPAVLLAHVAAIHADLHLWFPSALISSSALVYASALVAVGLLIAPTERIR